MRWQAIVTSRRIGAVAALALLALPFLSLQPVRAQGPTFVELQPIILSVFEGNEVSRQARIALALELASGKTAGDIEPLKPRLLDAFIGELNGIYEERRHADRVIDPAVIKPRLLETATRILGPGVVKDVLIQQAFERPRVR